MTASKQKHDAIQADIAAFRNTGGTMLDFFVQKSVSTGVSNLDELAIKLKLSKESIIRNISNRLFKVEGDTISLAISQ